MSYVYVYEYITYCICSDSDCISVVYVCVYMCITWNAYIYSVILLVYCMYMCCTGKSSLIFFDEFEALAPKRGRDNTGK